MQPKHGLLLALELLKRFGNTVADQHHDWPASENVNIQNNGPPKSCSRPSAPLCAARAEILRQNVEAIRRALEAAAPAPFTSGEDFGQLLRNFPAAHRYAAASKLPACGTFWLLRQLSRSVAFSVVHSVKHTCPHVDSAHAGTIS